MPDETTAALLEIANLSRRRVEQHDETGKRIAKREQKSPFGSHYDKI